MMPQGDQVAIVRIIAIFIAMCDKAVGYFGVTTDLNSNCGGYINVQLTSCGLAFADALADLMGAGVGFLANILTGLGVAYVTTGA